MHAPLLALTLVAGFATASSPPDDAADAIAFETIAVISDTTGINLVPHVPIAVRNADDLADLEGIMSDGFSGDLADRVMAAVEQVPTGMMPLVGIIDTSCGPPSTPGLSIDTDGNVAMYALDPVPNQPECFVAVDTVAVLAVDPADVPIGAAGPAELLAFERLSGSVTGAPSAAELGRDATAALSAMVGPEGDVPNLPPLVKGTRRFRVRHRRLPGRHGRAAWSPAASCSHACTPIRSTSASPAPRPSSSSPCSTSPIRSCGRTPPSAADRDSGARNSCRSARFCLWKSSTGREVPLTHGCDRDGGRGRGADDRRAAAGATGDDARPPAHVRQRRGGARRTARRKLAGALRIFGRFGFGEGVAGHITVRDPEFPDLFWVNPFGMSFRHIRSSDLILVDHDGDVVYGDQPVNRAAFVIHSAIHEARPDVDRRRPLPLAVRQGVQLARHPARPRSPRTPASSTRTTR